MSTSLKLIILGMVLISDIVIGSVIAARLLARGQGIQAGVLVAGLTIGWIALAVIFFGVM